MILELGDAWGSEETAERAECPPRSPHQEAEEPVSRVGTQKEVEFHPSPAEATDQGDGEGAEPSLASSKSAWTRGGHERR